MASSGSSTIITSPASSSFASLLKHHAEAANREPFGLSIDTFKALLYALFTQDPVPNDAQIASFLTIVKVGGYELRPEYLKAAAEVLFKLGNPYVHDRDDLPSESGIDIVGTGGDGKDTLNCSTAAAMVAASCGSNVYKHGNRASTSASGSADVLESLGVSLTPRKSSSTTSFHFLFAPLYYPFMSRVKTARKLLPFPTLFNILGPLLNPARVKRAVIGVWKEELGPVVLEVLKLLGVEKAAVVWGMEGLDEISPEGKTKIWRLDPQAGITTETISPHQTFGLQPIPLTSVTSPPNPSATLTSILSGTSPPSALYFVLMNAALVLQVDGRVGTLQEGFRMAGEAVRDGRAMAVLEKLREEGRE